jgi:uncharacterized membrane protein HdeD (DUF308 family)
MQIEFLLGSVLLLSGMLCIIRGLWADPKPRCVPIGYSAGSIFVLLGLVLFFSAVHSCALSTCLAVIRLQ